MIVVAVRLPTRQSDVRTEKRKTENVAPMYKAEMDCVTETENQNTPEEQTANRLLQKCNRSPAVLMVYENVIEQIAYRHLESYATLNPLLRKDNRRPLS